MNMKLMVLGSEITAQKITASLDSRGIEVVSASDGPQTIALLKEERFDLAAIDASVEETEVACRCINELFDIPVVLIVKETEADWEKLMSPDTDGYITVEASGVETAARLKAVIRRWSSYSKSILNVW